MILSDFILHSRANARREYTGIDSFNRCLNKEHFKNYPYPVEYAYNSRGFRDTEWPESSEELKNAIWCIGDSFTAGVGSPLEHTWPFLLQQQTGRRCINIGMDGASNAWISRRARQIIHEINPTHMVVLWSYVHRRELPNVDISDEARKLHFDKSNSELDDFKDFINCYTNLKNCTASVNIFNGTIPCSGMINDHGWNDIKDPSWPEFLPTTQVEFDQLPCHVKQETSDIYSNDQLETWFIKNNFCNINQLTELSMLDYARDYHHFDCITSEFFVKQILKNFDD
jgi:hypothetical protein